MKEPHIEFNTSIHLHNGHHASDKNFRCIYAQSTKECTGVHGVPYIDAHKPYFEKWVIIKDAEGYIFREVAHGGGICGHHKTVRKCVITARRSGIRIFFTPGFEHRLINKLFDYTKYNTGNFARAECYYGETFSTMEELIAKAIAETR